MSPQKYNIFIKVILITAAVLLFLGIFLLPFRDSEIYTQTPKCLGDCEPEIPSSNNNSVKLDPEIPSSNNNSVKLDREVLSLDSEVDRIKTLVLRSFSNYDNYSDIPIFSNDNGRDGNPIGLTYISYLSDIDVLPIDIAIWVQLSENTKLYNAHRDIELDVYINGPEIFLVRPTRSFGNGLYAFQFQVRFKGNYNVWPRYRIDAEGASADTPLADFYVKLPGRIFEAGVRDWRELSQLQFEITTENNVQVAEIYADLPSCRTKVGWDSLFNLQGRFIHKSYLTSDMIEDVNYENFLNDSMQHVYIPDTCKIKYFNSEEARSCLAGKQLLFLGDSTMQENFDELMEILWDIKNGECKPTVYRLGYQRIEEENIDLVMCWAGAPGPIKNTGQGTESFANPKFQFRVHLCSHYPQILPFIDHDDGFSIKNESMSDFKMTQMNYSQPDFLFYNSGLHDIQKDFWHTRNFQNYEFNLQKYLKRELIEKNIATEYIFLSTLQKYKKVNFFIRAMNTAAKKIAHGYGMDFLDAYAIHESRSDFFGGGGDTHHASRQFAESDRCYRSPYVHANVQMLLNRICRKD